MLCYLCHWRLDLFQFFLIFVNADRVGSVFSFLDHMFLSELLFGNLTHKLIYLCFALYVSQVSESTIIVIWKCIEFALLTFDLVGFERILLIAICFCIFWHLQICFMLCCHCLTRLNLDFFLDRSIIDCFLGNTISLGRWIVIHTYLIPLILRSVSLNLITALYFCTCRSRHFMHHLFACLVPYFWLAYIYEFERA